MPLRCQNGVLDLAAYQPTFVTITVADSADALLKVGAHLMDKPLAVEGDTPNVPTGGLNDHLGTGCRGSAPA